MKSFNLSEWALNNRGLVVYFMVVMGIAGLWSYGKLGQSEDPPFTFRVMVVKTFWPGATAEEVDQQITDRIEEKLQSHEFLDTLRSYSRPGESQVFFIARDDTPSHTSEENFYQVRKKIGDIKHSFPQGTIGPFFNDEFADTFGNIYALTGKDFSYAELKDYADLIRRRFLRIKDVSKVEYFGLQDEKIEIRVANTKRSELGIPLDVIVHAIQSQNAVTAAGFFETQDDRIYLRISGGLRNLEDIRNTPIFFNGRTFRAADVADIQHGYSDPPQPRVRFGGEEAIALGISMKKGGDIVALGKSLDTIYQEIQDTLPRGLTLSKVNDQPKAVAQGVGAFIRALAEAVIIVLAVSFLSLGRRAGLVVALTIPLVLAMTFAAMHYFNIGLHKTSLGALVLSLGLLVDDAIIAVEMMAIKMEQGLDRMKAAAAAYSSTAFPMLSGTLITAAGFLPIATAKSSTGEYTIAIFQVTALALLISWVAAVIFVPYLGFKLLPSHAANGHAAAGHDPYQTRFYRTFRNTVEWCVNRRWLVIGITLVAFFSSLYLFRYVQQLFFPVSSRMEMIVDLRLSEGASLTATDEAAKRMEKILAEQEGLDNYIAYIGSGAPRFVLPLDVQLAASSFAQFVLTTSNIEARDRIRAHLLERLPREFPEAITRVNLLENGPPVGYAVQFRVSGDDLGLIQKYADEVAEVMRASPYLKNVNKDWGEPSKIVRLVIDQDRARALGVSTQSVAQFLQTAVSGGPITYLRENNKLIEIQFRGPPEERARLSLLENTAVPRQDGSNIPLNQIAHLEYGFEPGILWRRQRMPTVTVRGDLATQVQAVQTVNELTPALDVIRAKLPPGYALTVGGSVDESAKGQASINAGLPLFFVVVLTVLMLQLRSFSRSVLVILTAPLGMIGVTASLLIFQQPFGFVAMLGTIALSGMIMRNSVILVDQIEQDIAAGEPPAQAIVNATVRRFRPIVLTALAAILAMIPLLRSLFFGPMAVAIMGGLVSATLLTLLFLPALYAAWFRIPSSASGGGQTTAHGVA